MIGAVAACLAVVSTGQCRRCPAPPPAPDLDPVRAGLAEAYAQANLCAPCEDRSLSTAAEVIAASTDGGLPDPVTLQREVQAAGGGDPAPRAMLLSAHGQEALARNLDQQWRPEAVDDVVGLGLARGPEGVRLVVLAANRKVRLDPLPIRVPVGSRIRVQGTLLTALRSPALYVEGPAGAVTRIAPTLAGSGFSAGFEPGAPGPYRVEVVGQGAAGPEVLFLKTVEVGTGDSRSSSADTRESGPDDAVAVLDRINRERLENGAAALALDRRLATVAQAYARELRELGIFAHVSPRSGDLKARLARAGYRYRTAAENLAQGPTALEAQALAANSPAHRQAMLDPTYTRCGIGMSRAISGEGSADVILVEVFALDRP